MTPANITIIDFVVMLTVIVGLIYFYRRPGTFIYRKKYILFLVVAMAVGFSFQFYEYMSEEPQAVTASLPENAILWQEFEQDALRAEGDYRLKYQELFELVIPDGYKYQTMTYQELKLIFAKGSLPGYEAVGVVTYSKIKRGLNEAANNIIETIKKERPSLKVDAGKEVKKSGAVMLVNKYSERSDETGSVGYIAFLKGDNKLVMVNMNTPRVGNYSSRMQDFVRIIDSMELVGE